MTSQPYEQEQGAVHDEGREKDIRQIRHQLGVKAQQHEQQNAPEQGGRGIGGCEELRELLGQLVVALIAGPDPDNFTDPGKDRDAQHKPCQQ